MENLQIDLHLTKVREHFRSDLEVAVIETFVNTPDWKTYLLDVSKHGCASGMVSELIYYNQTTDFHDEHDDEIDELIEDYVKYSGLLFSELTYNINIWEIKRLKNWKSWFAYEHVINQIIRFVEELENEID